MLFVKYIENDAVPGWATILGCVLFFGGFQLIILGIMGEYIGRIFEETKGRPLYLVEETLNFPEKNCSEKVSRETNAGNE